MQRIDRTSWQAATVGILRIEPLADSVTERWVTEAWGGYYPRIAFLEPRAAGRYLVLHKSVGMKPANTPRRDLDA
jgi:hypothetical protein